MVSVHDSADMQVMLLCVLAASYVVQRLIGLSCR